MPRKHYVKGDTIIEVEDESIDSPTRLWIWHGERGQMAVCTTNGEMPDFLGEHWINISRSTLVDFCQDPWNPDNYDH